MSASILPQACATESVTEVVVASVSVVPVNAAVERGATVEFDATVSDEDGAALADVIVTWASSAPAVLSVDQTGVARALSGGTARVEASFHGVVGQATVVVLPSAGFTVEETNGDTRVRETGARDSLTLRLDAMPSTDVRLSVTSQAPSEARASPSTLTFTPSSWSTPRTVVVRGVEDLTVDGDQTALVSVSVEGEPGSGYAAVASQVVTVMVLDDDVADLEVTESDGKTSAREGDAPDTLAVALSARPLSAVLLTVASDDTTDATVSPVRLTFTPTNWNLSQAVAFTAVDDFVRDGNRERTVTIAVQGAGSDEAFRGLSRSITATTRDDRKRLDEGASAAVRSAPR